jgi:hypothetical protein
LHQKLVPLMSKQPIPDDCRVTPPTEPRFQPPPPYDPALTDGFWHGSNTLAVYRAADGRLGIHGNRCRMYRITSKQMRTRTIVEAKPAAAPLGVSAPKLTHASEAGIKSNKVRRTTYLNDGQCVRKIGTPSGRGGDEG